MFYYFGRKGRLAPHYPRPEFDLVIEPFAGSMAYTLHHHPCHAIGIEINASVCSVWHSVCSLTAEEILLIPEPEIGEIVHDRWSMFAAGSHGTTRATTYKWTGRMARDLVKQKRMAARCVDHARTINYRHGSFLDLPDVEATWFIDPPYQRVARGYERSGIDYLVLAEWCRSRRGQVIVCEQAGANWLPFIHLREIKGTNNKMSSEVFWTNDMRPAELARLVPAPLPR